MELYTYNRTYKFAHALDHIVMLAQSTLFDQSASFSSLFLQMYIHKLRNTREGTRYAYPSVQLQTFRRVAQSDRVINVVTIIAFRRSAKVRNYLYCILTRVPIPGVRIHSTDDVINKHSYICTHRRAHIIRSLKKMNETRW